MCGTVGVCYAHSIHSWWWSITARCRCSSPYQEYNASADIQRAYSVSRKARGLVDERLYSSTEVSKLTGHNTLTPPCFKVRRGGRRGGEYSRKRMRQSSTFDLTSQQCRGLAVCRVSPVRLRFTRMITAAGWDRKRVLRSMSPSYRVLQQYHDDDS